MKTRSFSLFAAAALVLASAPAHASQWLKLTGPAKSSTLPLLAQTVNFAYAIDIPGISQHTHEPKSTIGVWITVCTGSCSSSGDTIDYRQLGPSEQSATTLAISKIKDHLTQKNLPLSTPIKWNLRFHLPGTIYDVTEVQTDSTFFLGHLEAVGTPKIGVKPTASVPH